VEVGYAADEVARIAEEEGVDLIVISTHGHTGFQRFLLGSVTERVIRYAPCPVLSVRAPSEK
jgi:nucleotide-binding universal stress UspA family protein